MDSVFLKILNMSITASWLILAVVVLRLVLKKAPKAIICALWMIVAIRLICPFSFESALSLIPSAETVSPDILYMQNPTVSSGIPIINSIVNPVISESSAPAIGASVNPLQGWTAIASYVWLFGVAAMLGYAIISYLSIKRKVSEGAPFRDNIWLCDHIDTPFILGIAHPRIYLPSAMEDTQSDYVIAHENTHLKRRDHWWKPLGFALLTFHWFNPLCWLAYLLLCKDIEIACDEKVVSDWDAHDKKAYSEALLSCSVPRRMVAACPLAFGEVGVKERIKAVLKDKKPVFWMSVVAVAACIIVAVCFLTNPKSASISFGNIQITWAKALDTRPNEPTAWDLNDAQLDELRSRLLDLNVGRRDSDYGGLTPMYSLSVKAQNMEQFAIIGYDINGNNVALSYKGEYYQIKDEEFTRYLSAVCAGEDVTAAMQAVELVIGEPYVSSACLYMNFLSSFAAFGGDSGCRYLIGEDSFTIVNRSTGAVEAISPVSWGWQPFPWTDEEWDALFMVGGIPNINEAYNEVLYQPLNSGRYLMKVDGQLWLVEIHDINKMGRQIWSIYTLVQESSLGSAQWDFQPALSSKYPAFLLRFDLPYTEISATCEQGRLIGYDDHDGTGYPQGASLTVPAGSALYWSPMNENGSTSAGAEIHFSVRNNRITEYAGTIYITREEGGDIYTARVVGSGLGIRQSQDAYGGEIFSAAASTVGEADGLTQITVNTRPLDAAVSAAIRAHNWDGNSDGLIHCESHVVLATEGGGPANSGKIETVTVYAMVLYQEYGFSGATFHEVSGSHGPVAITFDMTDSGEYVLSEYWIPRDGSYYAPDIREKFPEAIAKDALDTQKYILVQKQNCYAQAVEYGKVDTDFLIEQLLETIMSSPAASSNPGDYINAHPIEYREMTYYGDYTLRYIFSRFLNGGQTDLRGHIMRSVMDDLIGDEAINLEADNGQAYFDAWREYVEQMYIQNGEMYMREYAPKSWLLMEVSIQENE